MAVGKKQLHRQQLHNNQTQFNRRSNNFKAKDASQNLVRKSLTSASSSRSSGSTSSEVRLYTSHFDARNKINQKKGIKVQAQAPRSASQVIAKKALRKGVNTLVKNAANRSNPNKFESNNNKRKPTKNTPLSDRETTFTGKSIKVSTTNDLAPKERKALMKGKSLSIIAKNKPVKSNKSPLNKTINNSSNTHTWVGPNQAPLPDPIPPTPAINNKKAIPAKLVISNLHPNVTQEDILELFGAIGALRDGRLKSVGTAEVVYRVAEDAFAAYSKYHGRNLDGQPMILKITTAEEAGSSTGSSNFLPSTRQSNKVQSNSLLSSSSTSYPSFSSNVTSSATPVVFTVKL